MARDESRELTPWYVFSVRVTRVKVELCRPAGARLFATVGNYEAEKQRFKLTAIRDENAAVVEINN